MPKTLTPSVPLSLGKGAGERKSKLGDTPSPLPEGVKPPLHSPEDEFRDGF